MIAESLLGGIAGGVFRLVPEVMKLLDRKNEREHEHRMMMVEVAIAEKRIEAGLREGDQRLQASELQAMAEALREQGETARAAGRLVAAISALVRPLVTYWLVFLYSAHKLAAALLAYERDGDWREIVQNSWGEQDWTIMSMVLTFWFVGRVWERSSASRG
jgi:hypothetical protein